jgi:hypothetical protein
MELVIIAEAVGEVRVMAMGGVWGGDGKPILPDS